MEEVEEADADIDATVQRLADTAARRAEPTRSPSG
jgi:hypothetical protein